MTEEPAECVITFPFHIQTGNRGRKRIHDGKRAEAVEIPLGRTPRIARLMALAIHFEEKIRSGGVSDFGEIARLGQVTRPRITQIMNLLLLAPDIQEELLALPMSVVGKDLVTEKKLRQIVALVAWDDQRRAWRRIAPYAANRPAPYASHANSTSGS